MHLKTDGSLDGLDEIWKEPDPFNTPMTLEEEERMGLKQILDRYRQIQRPVKTWEQMREELIVRLLLGRPTLTREKAAEQIDAF
jgi:hypothetical protein